MRPMYRTALTAGLIASLALAGSSAEAQLSKTDKKCLQTVAKEGQKLALARQKELAKCAERPSSPASAQCPDGTATNKINKAEAKFDKKVAKKCGADKFDPSNLGYGGCMDIASCESTDATASGYLECAKCTTAATVDRAFRNALPGSCGNGHLGPGEECDGGSTCTSGCLIRSVCGNEIIQRGEECESTLAMNGCTGDDTCVPAGYERECTCVPPCTLTAPIPSKITAITTTPSGQCGCTVTDTGELDCATATSKLFDLDCGSLYIGGGQSTVPPGTTPDGAMSVASLDICTGTELLIGPSPGTGEKDCSFGEAEAPAGAGVSGCRFGPMIDVVNSNPALSSCVRNTLAENVKGVMDPTDGSSTIRISLTSRVFLTGDDIKSTCRGGATPGSPCTTNASKPRGIGQCGVTGGNLNALCPESDCGTGGTCFGICGSCTGGSNDGTLCQADSDCTGGGTCGGVCAEDVIGKCSETCVGGTDAGEDCQEDIECSGGTCGSTTATCVGGSEQGQSCTVDSDCGGGGVCGSACTIGSCVGGTAPGRLCTDDSDCTGGGTCTGVCSGGSNPGALCTDDSECMAGGDCSIDDCSGPSLCQQVDFDVEPCPVCTDANFEPVSKHCSTTTTTACVLDSDCPATETCVAGTGTCNLGANRGAACSSTNKDGLTIDCPPNGGSEEEVGEGNTGDFLADLPVSLDPLTTGTATMADEDGNFCDFGYCKGGDRDGLGCDNPGVAEGDGGRHCPGGTCQAVCQGGSNAGDDCGSDDDCQQGEQAGVCGQREAGAFSVTEGGGPTVRRIIMTGTPAAAPVQVGDVKSSTLGSVFCIPVTPDQAVNSAGSIPGPGATAITQTIIVE